MSDTEADQPRKKRAAERQLTKDAPGSDSEGAEDDPNATWDRADESILKTRKRYRVKKRDPNAAAVEAAAAAQAAHPIAQPASFSGFSFNVATSAPESAKASLSPSKSQESATSAPVAQSLADPSPSPAPATTPASPASSVVASSSTPSKSPAEATPSSAETKAPAFDFKPAFTFSAPITPTTAASSNTSGSDAPAPAFQFSNVFTAQAAASPFKFNFPLANAAAPDMQVQGNAVGSKFFDNIKTIPSSATLNLFGKDIAKPAETANFPAAPTGESDNKESDEDGDAEAAQPTVVLAPSVTGEEDDETLFSEKTKLYEFDKESKQWVEKGKGVLKLNKHKSNDKVRILMRIEPAHRLAINGVLLPGAKVSVDAKRPKVVSLTLPASYIMGHESAGSEMSVLSLRFLEDSHGQALVDLAKPYISQSSTSSSDAHLESKSDPTKPEPQQ